MLLAALRMKAISPDSVSTSDILRDVFSRKTTRNPAFSLRAFARDLGVSHTYLSLVLNGKKSLSMSKVIQFSSMLGLDSREADLFMKAGAREARGRAAHRADPAHPSRVQRAKALEAYFELETDRYRVLNEWYHIPILELTFTADFIHDPRWVGKRLGISTEQVKDAFDRLKRLGLLELRDGRLTKTQERLSLQPRKFEKSVRDFHRQMILKALDALESARTEDYEARDITGSTISIDPALIPEARKKIQAFRRSLIKFLGSGNATEVYQINVQLFPLTGRTRPLARESGPDRDNL